MTDIFSWIVYGGNSQGHMIIDCYKLMDARCNAGAWIWHFGPLKAEA